jgi:hypothetical protein
MQGELHAHTPHVSQQFIRIYNMDPTLMPTYYELGDNNAIKNYRKGLITFTTSYHMSLLNI